MQPNEFADEIFRLWPKAFMPRESWHGEIIDAVSEFSVAQLKGALGSLKFKRAGRAIDLAAIVEACRASNNVTALPGTGLAAAFKREPNAYILSFLGWLRSRGLSDQYRRMPMVEQVMISRLCAILWGGSLWEMEADRIAGEGLAWDRLSRLYERALEAPECLTNSSRGWLPPWAEKTQGTA